MLLNHFCARRLHFLRVQCHFGHESMCSRRSFDINLSYSSSMAWPSSETWVYKKALATIGGVEDDKGADLESPLGSKTFISQLGFGTDSLRPANGNAMKNSGCELQCPRED